jgi:GT2 family glycosyltransferase
MNPSDDAGSASPRVSISVVTYNNSQCLDRFLASLHRQRGVSFEVFFFDNASSDDTVRLLKESALGELHASPVNLGYGKGHNSNLGHASGEFLVVLNADVEFEADMIARLVRHMDENPSQAIAGPVVFEGEGSRPFPPRRFYPGEGMIALEKGFERKDIAWINGCAMIIRRDVMKALDGFDGDYFLYQSETDLCLRARRSGHSIGYCDDVMVRHFHRQSQRDVSEYEYARRIFEGSAVFWRKHYSGPELEAIARFQLRMSSALLALGKPLTRYTGGVNVLSPERLRARRDVCAKVLNELGRTSGQPAAGLRIISRQARIALEWVRQRRFPLDDY